MSVTIQGLGTARPRHAIDQARAAEAARNLLFGDPQHARLLPTLFRRARVERRGSVILEPSEKGVTAANFYRPARAADDFGPTTAARMERYAEEAPPLAERAARAALEDAALPPRAITHLVTVSCTGFASPGVEFALIERLGLAPSVGRANLGFMGCHGALNGLRVAQAFVEADPRAKVLLCAAELCSLHYQYGSDPQHIVANSLFADGAAALVATADRREADAARWRLAGTGSLLVPDSEDAMEWRVRDHGFQMRLSPRVPELIGEHLRPWLGGWLGERGRRLDQIGSWAIHPGGPRIVAGVAEALDLSSADTAVSNEVLAQCGNMSSPTVLFVLGRLRASRAPRPCVALAFGPGLVVEAALFV